MHEGALVYALGALKNVGVEAMRLFTQARHVEGVERPFVTLFDVARRVDLKARWQAAIGDAGPGGGVRPTGRQPAQSLFQPRCFGRLFSRDS